ncbi:hypothetical protein C8Q70DRAFT_385833 [Cubamyces menziesii]|nr:hypothetical protein C8Q70DRAFT_385833 [Cubamyces menziesii]
MQCYAAHESMSPPRAIARRALRQATSSADPRPSIIEVQSGGLSFERRRRVHPENGCASSMSKSSLVPGAQPECKLHAQPGGQGISQDTFGVDHSCQSSFCLLANGSKLYTPKFAKTPGYASSALPCSLPMLIHQTPPVHSTADLRRVILSARARGTKASIHVVQMDEPFASLRRWETQIPISSVHMLHVTATCPTVQDMSKSTSLIHLKALSYRLKAPCAMVVGRPGCDSPKFGYANTGLILRQSWD